ncbi:beta-lactamase/transpeptidase-like protein [Thozetella sp. PMI_491]|nr:beta-lactamase/transpeptidase-like protein [Thozetella sp. PMI_491]
MSFTGIAAFLSLLLPQGVRSQGNTPCPILGAYYPIPTTLASSRHLKNATATIEAQIQEAMSKGTLDGNTTTLSVEVYSIHDDSPLFTFHYTPEALASQRTAGVAKVDSSTVYRIGSVSKLWTAYLYLITAGDSSWARPVTDFVPELAAVAQQRRASDNEVDNVSWDTITVGALASHMGGIGRDADWYAGLETTYSNAGYQILAYALQNITGRPLSDLFQEHLVESLRLSGTYYHTPPTTDTSVIPIDTTTSWWDFDYHDKTPAAGYYSTTNDVSLVGKAILNSTLLSPAQTRRWMKPHAFTSNPDAAVGAPWEIMRAPGTPISWIYAKSGDAGAYSAMTMLIPDLGVGMSVLAAGSTATSQVLVASDLLAGTFVPAFWAQGKAQATVTYAGTYTNASGNTTITVTAACGTPGLVVTEFTLGGQDVLQALSFLLQQDLTLRLYHVGLAAAGDSGTKIESWRAIFEAPGSLPSTPSASCVSWLLINPYVYGGVGLDEFLFTLDSTANVENTLF